MPTQIIDVKQLNYRLDTLKPNMRVAIAVLIQRLRVRGHGRLMLIEVMRRSDIYQDSFYRQAPVNNEVLEVLNWIATDNGCLIGRDLTVDALHYNFLNQGIVV